MRKRCDDASHSKSTAREIKAECFLFRGRMRIELMYSWAVNNGRIIGRETLVKGGISDMHTGSTLTLRALPLVGIAAILSMAANGQAGLALVSRTVREG